MRWSFFSYGGQIYDLSHLDPQVHTFVQSASERNVEKRYSVNIEFSLHCFTRKPLIAGDTKGPLGYGDSRESRIFDFSRYEHSKDLLTVIQRLPLASCYHTQHGNFFTIKTVTCSGSIEEYEVYFVVSRSSKEKVMLNLFVQTAYVRDSGHRNRPNRKKIGFFVILNNVLRNVAIRPPA
jgi:hypothetical protein